MKRLIRHYSVSAFFFGAFLWSWLLWIPAAVFVKIQGSLGPLSIALVFLGGLGPTVSAIAISGVLEGKKGIRALFGRIVGKGSSPWAYAAVLILPFAAAFGFVGLNLLAGGSFASFSLSTGLAAFLPRFLMVLPFGPLCEELGWRGFAIPRLRERRSALTSSLWLGLWWGLWHLPLFAVPGVVMGPGEQFSIMKLISYVLTTIGLSVIFTTVLDLAKGAVWTTMLLHGLFNSAVPTVLAAYLGFAAAPGAIAGFLHAFSVLALALICAIFAHGAPARVIVHPESVSRYIP